MGRRKRDTLVNDAREAVRRRPLFTDGSDLANLPQCEGLRPGAARDCGRPTTARSAARSRHAVSLDSHLTDLAQFLDTIAKAILRSASAQPSRRVEICRRPFADAKE